MKQKTIHTIQKELIEVTLPDFETARNWELHDRKPFVEIARKVLDETFAEYDGIPSHLIMQKLVLDLGTFSKDSLLKELPERLRKELQKILSELIHSPAYDSRELKELANGRNKSQEFEHQMLTGPKAKLESFLYFLKEGRLPWWATGEEDWNVSWLEDLKSESWFQLKSFLKENQEPAIARLTTQFNAVFVARILSGIQSKNDTTEMNEWVQSCNWLEFLVQTCKKEIAGEVIHGNKSIFTSHQIPSIQYTQQQYWIRWFNYALQGEQQPRLIDLFKKFPEFTSWFVSRIGSKNIFSNKESIEFKTPLMWQRELEEMVIRIDIPIPTASSYDSESRDESNTEKKNALPQKPSHKKRKEFDENEKIFLKDAGIVILHPFLSQLFQHCSLLDKNKFIDAAAQTRAIHLIYFLARGVEEIKEYELLLPKLLCGMLWETPLEAIEPLNDIEKSAAEDLLTQVIKYWKELRSTSPDGLRQAFLQRDGRLESRDDGWQLLVEGKAQDVLLSRLPWGFAIIKYPWMNGMLSVSWT